MAPFKHPLRQVLVALACVQPVALTQQDMQAQQENDLEAMRQDVVPLSAPDSGRRHGPRLTNMNHTLRCLSNARNCPLTFCCK